MFNWSKTAIHELITEEFNRSKSENTSREHRIDFANTVIEGYFSEHGKKPNGTVLQRLASLILHDEIKDTNAYKIRHNDYPFLSPRQERRRKGIGLAKTSRMGEISEKALAEVAIDGRSYRSRTRTTNRKFRELFKI